MAWAESYVFEGAAVFAKCGFAFRAAIEIVENRPWQAAACDWPKVFDADNVGRCNCPGRLSHLRFQYLLLVKT